jgi:outer membrane protein assembly factor BamB
LKLGVLHSRRRKFAAGLLVGLLALLVSACGPVHTDPRWASVSTMPDGNILLAFADRLTLVNPVDGKPIQLLDTDGTVRLDDAGNPRVWDVKATDNQQTRFYSSPIVLDENTLLIASYDKRVLEIDVPVARLDGDIGTLDQHIVARPVVDGEMVYVGLSDKDFVALNLADLTEAWRIVTDHGVWADAVVVGDVVYFSSMDHYLYAANKQTGDLIWKTDMQGAMTASPVYQDGHLYVGTFGRKLFDVDAETGAVIGEFPTSEWVWNAPALVDGVLYISDLGGMVYAVDTSDGLNALWSTKVSDRAVPPTPVVTGDFVIVGSRDHNVYWLNRSSGAVVDKKQVGGEVLSNMVLIEPSETVNVPEPLVIVSTSANEELLVAFTAARGQRLWSYKR